MSEQRRVSGLVDVTTTVQNVELLSLFSLGVSEPLTYVNR